MIWDRQKGESYKAFEAFKLFLTIQPRTYTNVADKLDKSLTLIKRWAKEHNWRNRADAYDSELQRQALEKTADDYAAMIQRNIQVGKMLQIKAANAIQNMDLANLPPKFLPALVTMAKAGAQLERSARELNREGNTADNLLTTTLQKIWDKTLSYD